MEKQRAVQGEVAVNAEGSVLMAKTIQQNSKSQGGKRNQKKDDRSCDYCKATGHVRDTCFKLQNYPDWYKQLKKDKATLGGKGYANLVNNASEEGNESRKDSTTAKWGPAMTELIQQEVNQILKGKQQASEAEQVNFAQISDFAGNISNSNFFSYANDIHSCWIVDTGDTNHICEVEGLLENLKPLANKILIHLPDDSTKNVQSHGDIWLHETLILHDVLFIPSFKHNLLSVAKLCENNTFKFTFYPLFCILQDLRTESIIAVGQLRKQLYILDTKSFSPELIRDTCNFLSSADFVNNCVANNVNSSSGFTWHRRMGHPSELVMQHLP